MDATNIQQPTENIKVFGIGLQKTGLTSLLKLMRECGLKGRGIDEIQRQNFFLRHDYDSVLDYFDSADFFCDWPVPLMYRLAFEKYGARARFILTLRKDSRAWFESLKRHNAYAHPVKNKHRWVFGRYYPHGFDREHIEYYERHHAEVLEFFAARNASHQLLVVNLERPEAIAAVSEFLQTPIERRQAPHENRSRGDLKGAGNLFKRYYNRVVQSLYARLAPRLFKAPAKQRRVVEADALQGSRSAQADPAPHD